jgi:hypothetical protein
MADRWHYRKEHARRLRTGRTISVCGSWVLQCERVSRSGSSFKRACPLCGALIVSVGMPKGGWVHFEGGEGLTRIKHPCLHLGEGLSRRRDATTPDLFAMSP